MSLRVGFLPRNVGARVSRPIVNGDYQLSEMDLGVVLNTASSTATLPSYTDFQVGKEYSVKNGSNGIVSVVAGSGETIVIQGQLVPSVSIPADFSRQFARETTTGHWIIL